VSSGSITPSRLTRKSYRWREPTQDFFIHPADRQPVAEELSMLKTYCQSTPLELPVAESGAASLPEILSALSFALDLTEGAVPGHDPSH
jgi:hypothetical protein